MYLGTVKLRSDQVRSSEATLAQLQVAIYTILQSRGLSSILIALWSLPPVASVYLGDTTPASIGARPALVTIIHGYRYFGDDQIRWLLTVVGMEKTRSSTESKYE